jgi:Flp pilus assembly protein TadG
VRKMSRLISRYFQRRWSRILRHCGDLCGESGASLVEVALILSFFGVPLLFGTSDMATLVYSSIELSNAAHVGAMYGMVSSNAASEIANITTAAQNEATDFVTSQGASTLTVTPTSYYACSVAEGGTQYPNTAAGLTSASSACPTSAVNHYLLFVQVVVSGPVTLPFSCCGLSSTITLSSKSVMEVE